MSSMRQPSSTFFRVRVAVLLAALFGVALWAVADVRSRRERNAWERPLSIAVVLVRRGPLDDEAIEAFRDRISALDTRMTEEFRRYRHTALHPFVFVMVGPVDAASDPPIASGEGWLDAAGETWALWRWTSTVDRAIGLSAGDYDSRIYVAARPAVHAGSKVVEGESQDGGRIGTVRVELDASMADFALCVVAHELFHTLGARDKYAADGSTLIPLGLAEPDRAPLVPQAKLEVMARNRPIAPGVEVPPDALSEVAVGPTTAEEIGWTGLTVAGP